MGGIFEEFLEFFEFFVGEGFERDEIDSLTLFQKVDDSHSGY